MRHHTGVGLVFLLRATTQDADEFLVYRDTYLQSVCVVCPHIEFPARIDTRNSEACCRLVSFPIWPVTLHCPLPMTYGSGWSMVHNCYYHGLHRTHTCGLRWYRSRIIDHWLLMAPSLVKVSSCQSMVVDLSLKRPPSTIIVCFVLHVCGGVHLHGPGVN
jgi:hypothetical protein